MMLSDERIEKLWQKHCLHWPEINRILISPTVFARAIEAEVTQASEPVAWEHTWTNSNSNEVISKMIDDQPPSMYAGNWTHRGLIYANTTPQPCPKCELYIAEMSAAREAGFETAQDLFTSYTGLEAKCAELSNRCDRIVDGMNELLTLVERFEPYVPAEDQLQIRKILREEAEQEKINNGQFGVGA
jgi:hypothetical protein